MSRENKLGLIIGFAIVLLVGVLISDHYSPATEAEFANLDQQPFVAAVPQGEFQIVQPEPLAVQADPLVEEQDLVNFDPQAHEPLVIGGRGADMGQQIRSALGLNDIPTAPTQTVRNEPGVTHTVRHRESLAAIARRYYHDTDRWPEIFEANRHLLDSPDFVREGMQLRIPGVTSTWQAPAERAGTPRTDGPRVRTYTIQKNDVLGKISQNLTGTSRNWRRIYEANRDVIDDPDRLIPGRVIRIPADIAFPS